MAETIPLAAGDWPEEKSQEAEGFLSRTGVDPLWRNEEEFGEENTVVIGIRAGGFGVVYFVESITSGRKRYYAAKTLKSFLKPDYLELSPTLQKELSQAFLEETLPWLEMGLHPHIVSVHMLRNVVHPKLQRSIPFVFSEYMPRGSLRKYLKEKGKLTLRESLTLGIQICEGLLHAYDHGLDSHLDIKPENIMVHADGIFKVTDFSPDAFGTPGYMSPEQVLNYWSARGRTIISEDVLVDHRADQFAVGLIMLESCLGIHPFSICIKAFENSDLAKEFYSAGVGDFGDVSLPDTFRDILLQIFSSSPSDRFPDLSYLKGELLKVYTREYGLYEAPEVEEEDSAEWWFNRGKAFDTLNRPALSEEPFKKSSERYRLIPGAEPDCANCKLNLGIVYSKTGRFNDAERAYEEAMKIYRQIPGTEPRQAICKVNLGNVYRETGRFSESEEAYQEALRVYRRLPGSELYQAKITGNLGGVYTEAGRFDDAVNSLKEALTIFRRVPGSELDQARCSMNLGIVYRETGRHDEAEKVYKVAMRTYQSIPWSDFDQARCQMNLGAVYSETGRFTEAERLYEDALDIYRQIPGSELEQARCSVNLGNVLRETGRFPTAEKILTDALNIFHHIPGISHYRAQCLAELALCYQAMKNASKAHHFAMESLRFCEQFPPESTASIESRCHGILEELEREGKTDK
jgi:tetratricopeptide (TPR) repeat protein